ncbi:MAG TPA: HPr family phosphocarrier protein [Firmicutes bacterium]|nr:HPr family phosphocarrier protein [Bacillota bacterium]
MKEITLTVTNKLGLHARPAAAFVQTAAAFQSQISISTGTKEADAKSILGVLGLGVRQGTVITIRVQGSDENEAVPALQAFFETL